MYKEFYFIFHGACECGLSWKSTILRGTFTSLNKRHVGSSVDKTSVGMVIHQPTAKDGLRMPAFVRGVFPRFEKCINKTAAY